MGAHLMSNALEGGKDSSTRQLRDAPELEEACIEIICSAYSELSALPDLCPAPNVNMAFEKLVRSCCRVMEPSQVATVSHVPSQLTCGTS